MTTFNKKKLFLGLAAIALLISIPLTLSLISQQQDPRGRAAGSTTLSFEPATTTDTPMSVAVGDDIALDMYVDPGDNIVTFIRYQITFDNDKVQLDPDNPFELNQAVFSNVEGPVTQAGTIAQSISIGSDPTKAIQTRTKVGTLHLKAVAPTNGSVTALAFGSLTQALSSGANDQASQNVLASTTPAFIAISGSNGGITPSIQPSATLIPQPTITGTAVSFTLLLHGVGAAGDNPNPTGNSLSNKNPLHPQRNLQVEVYDTNNTVVASGSAPVTYDSNSGTFVGSVGLGSDVPSGNYNVKIKTDRYLRHLVPGIQQIQADVVNELPTTALIAGDSNGDNFLNVLDYNAMLDCGYGQLDPLPIADANSPFNSNECQVHTPPENVDLDDNGYINSFDYNLFLRELSVQNGD